MRALAHHHETALQRPQIAGPEQIGQGGAHEGQRHFLHPVVMHKAFAQAVHREGQVVLALFFAAPHETVGAQRFQQALHRRAVDAAGLRERAGRGYAAGGAVQRLQHGQAAGEAANLLVIRVGKRCRN